MNKKVLFSFLAAILLAAPIFAKDSEIILRIKPGEPSTGSRSENVVTASINEQVLTVSFTDSTASSIVVYEESDPNTVLFSQDYAPAYSAQADLTSLTTGDYVVEIYAFGTWWIGSFCIE